MTNAKIAQLNEAQVGAAGVHLVCADLLLQGCRVSVAAESLPYDIIADRNNKLMRVQVKTTASEAKDFSRAKGVFQFSLRHAKGSRKIYDSGDVDVFAFVFLKLQRMAYLPTTQIRNSNGYIKQTITWRSKKSGFVPKDRWGNKHTSLPKKAAVRQIENFGEFPW
jgi:hypothetical protein